MKSTEQALRAAQAYLLSIDGDNFGTPEGHNVEDVAELIDRITRLPQLLKALAAARAPLEHVAYFIQQFDRSPLDSADEFYTIHRTTEFEAGLKRSELRKAIQALWLLNAAPGRPPLSAFRQRVFDAWKDLGKKATSREIADQVHRNETQVSKALVWLEDHGFLISGL